MTPRVKQGVWVGGGFRLFNFVISTAHKNTKIWREKWVVLGPNGVLFKAVILREFSFKKGVYNPS
jgi:hypothetical protein